MTVPNEEDRYADRNAWKDTPAGPVLPEAAGEKSERRLAWSLCSQRAQEEGVEGHSCQSLAPKARVLGSTLARWPQLDQHECPSSR
jgi:hypothetical protein